MTEQEPPLKPIDPVLLQSFKLERVLRKDPKSKSINLLGKIEDRTTGVVSTALLLLEKTAFSESFTKRFPRPQTNQDGEKLGDECTEDDGRKKKPRLNHGDGEAEQGIGGGQGIFESLVPLDQNDIYTWLLADLSRPSLTTPPAIHGSQVGSGKGKDHEVKMTLIHPATPTHVQKYSEQSKSMYSETPEVYRSVVLPYIQSLPPSRINWVYNILEGRKEAESLLYVDRDPIQGFVILPDLKWDRSDLSSLYLQAIVMDRSLRSIRDLKSQHVGLLKSIVRQAEAVVEKSFFPSSSHAQPTRSRLRFFIHYQPSYYHLHVHILNSDVDNHPGAMVGQAHLVQDVIDLLESGVDFEKRTFHYALGDRSELSRLLTDRSQD
ncbi:HIT-like protein, partial [Violaceomyces palustris]